MKNEQEKQGAFSEIHYKGNIAREFVELAVKTRKFWLLPLILILLLLALLIFFGETAAAPFIYSLF